MNTLPTPTQTDLSGRAIFLGDVTQSPTLNLKLTKIQENMLQQPLETSNEEEMFTTPDVTMKSSQCTSRDDDDTHLSSSDAEGVLNVSGQELDPEVLMIQRELNQIESQLEEEEVLKLTKLKASMLRMNLKNTILKNELNREKLVSRNEIEMLNNQLNQCKEIIISNEITINAISNRNMQLTKYIKLLKDTKIKKYVNENRQLRAKLDHLDQQYYQHQQQHHYNDNTNTGSIMEDLSSSPMSPQPIPASKLNTLGRIASVYLGDDKKD